MGNPVITMTDRPSVGRIGSHYLKGINHLEWSAKDEEDYIEKSILLASDLTKLNTIRSLLRTEVTETYVKNPKHFVSELECTFRKMWDKLYSKC